jgi:5-methylcytosine-specific restriction endonuclease McrA
LGRQRRTGNLECFGELVVVALLVWPIQQLQPVFGWSGAEISRLELAWCGLLAVSAAVRRRASMRTASETTRGRLGNACEMGQAEAARRREAQARRAARERHLNRMRRPTGPRVVQNPLCGSLPASVSSERWDRARGESPANRAGTPAGYGVGRARDPLPAQLRFSILQRDGFRCRYCGRPGNAPGVVLHVDHVVPVIAGATTTQDNLLTACDECNLGKSTRAVVPAGS